MWIKKKKSKELKENRHSTNIPNKKEILQISKKNTFKKNSQHSFRRFYTIGNQLRQPGVSCECDHRPRGVNQDHSPDTRRLRLR